MAHLHTVVKVARDEDLLKQIGKDIYFDLVDHDKVPNFHIQNKMPFKYFKEEVAKEFGIPVQSQRFWLWAKRQNHTYRPRRPLTEFEEINLVGQIREVSKTAYTGELKLFLEVELGPDMKPIAPPKKTQEDILLFFKLYDPLTEEMRYIGRLFVKGSGLPSEILTKLNKMAGFNADEKIDLFEEIKFEPNVMCEHIDKKTSFRASELQDGDIICFQKSNVGGEQCRYPDVPSFLKYVRNRQYNVQEEFSKIDAVFADIHNILEMKTSKEKNSKIFGTTEIAKANEVLRQCMNLDINSIIQSGKAPELKSSLTFILASNSFPENILDATSKFVDGFDQSIESYEASRRDLNEARRSEHSVKDLETSLEQLASKFMPVRSEAEAIGREIDRLVKKIYERKAQKGRLMKRAEDLANEATISKEELVRAKQTMKLSAINKERAEQTVNDFERSWESLKELHNMSHTGKPQP